MTESDTPLDFPEELLVLSQKLAECGAFHVFVAGWAADLFMGRVTRPHKDIEIFLWNEDISKLSQMKDWTCEEVVGHKIYQI